MLDTFRRGSIHVREVVLRIKFIKSSSKSLGFQVTFSKKNKKSLGFQVWIGEET